MFRIFRFHATELLSAVVLAALLIACSVDSRPQPSTEKAEAVNQALKSALQLSSPSAEHVALLLRHGEYDKLDGLYEKAFSDYKQDVLYESPLQKNYELFSPSGSFAPEDLDDWVNASGSAIAYTARGIYRLEQASAARGTDYLSRTPKGNLDLMQSYCDQAAADLQTALEKNPELSPAWTALIRISMMASMPFGPDEIFEKAINQDRRSFYIRQQYMVSLQPRWGGSSEAMLGFGQFCAQDVQLNPRLWVLQGDLYSDGAGMLSLQGDHEQAVDMYTRALLFGDKLSTLQYRAYSLQKCGRNEEAAVDLRKILSYDPMHRAAIAMLARLKQSAPTKG